MADEEVTELVLLDVKEIDDRIRLLASAITEGKADDISTFFRDLLIRVRVNERTLDEYKRFIPIVYPQANNADDIIGDGIFRVLFGPYVNIGQSLLMMVPKESSIDTTTTGVNKLQIVRNGVIAKEFEIYKESNTGALIKASLGDIVPNRTVLFRLVNATTAYPKAIIINTSGLFSETISNLHVIGETIFGQKPIISVPGSTEADKTLVTKDELDAVNEDLQLHKSKFIFTESNPQEVAESNDVQPGSIIIQITK